MSTFSNEWNSTINTDEIILRKNNPLFIIPEHEIFINSSILYSIKVFYHALPSTHFLYKNYERSLTNITVPKLIKEIENLKICNGVKSFGSNVQPHVLLKVYDINDTNPLQQKVYYRTMNCEVLIEKDIEVCKSCDAQDSLDLKQKQRKENLLKTSKI